jgi:hypothetical protein
MGRSVKTEMLRAHRGSVEQQQATAFQHPVDDRGSEVIVVQDGAPGVGVLVRREDHRALRLMAMIDDVIEHVRRIGAVGQVADLVDDEDIRRDVATERVGEATVARCDRKIFDQLGGADEERVEAVLDRPIADRDGDVRLAAPRLSVEHE